MSGTPAFLRERSCRECGCTQTTACAEPDTGRPCYWAGPDLCSVCVQRGAATPEEAPLTDTAATPPPGYRENHRGHFIPEHQIAPHELLEDQLVTSIFCFAKQLSDQIARFKAHTYADCAGFLDVLAEEHGVTPRGLKGKGNVTFTSYDGRLRVKIRVQDRLSFGPGLQVAKGAIDECLRSWAADANPHLQSLIAETFNTDNDGQVSRSAVFRLMRTRIDDERWQRAMNLLRESIRPESSKSYAEVQYRRDSDGGYETLPISLAGAVIPEGMTASHVPAGAAPEGGA